MKNLKLLLLLITTLSFLQSKSHAQTLVKESAQWNILTTSWQSTKHTQSLKIEGDTLIDNIAYKKIIRSTDSLNQNWDPTLYVIREDSTKRVYLKKGSLDEYLLYDFSLTTGDTFHVDNQCKIAVIEVDSIQIDNGEMRRRMKMEADTGLDLIVSYWIEGIGDLYGFINYWSAYCATDHLDQLLCHYYDGALTFQNLPDGCFITTSTRELSGKDIIKVYPNPTKDVLRIEITSKDVVVEKISLYSSLGNMLGIQQSKTRSQEIDLSSFPTGFYYVVIELDNGALFSKKLSKI